MEERNNFDQYPKSCFINGENLDLVAESKWLRRFSSASGKFHVVSRLLDGSFDFSLLDQLEPSDLSPRERSQAALAIKVAGRTDIPPVWQQLVSETKMFSF